MCNEYSELSLLETPIFKSRQERAMASLCHGSLAFCCPLEKRCAERDRALEILGLTQEDYQYLKGDSHHRFIETAKGISQTDRDSITNARGARTVNRPAVDYGYGSDDYRRDFDTLNEVFHSRDDQLEKHRDTRLRHRDYSDTRNDRTLRDEMRSAVSEIGDMCSMRSEPSTEGLGALFSQGELSPFAGDSQSLDTGRGFCFTCGRTFKTGTRVCPYCGAMQ